MAHTPLEFKLGETVKQTINSAQAIEANNFINNYFDDKIDEIRRILDEMKEGDYKTIQFDDLYKDLWALLEGSSITNNQSRIIAMNKNIKRLYIMNGETPNKDVYESEESLKDAVADIIKIYFGSKVPLGYKVSREGNLYHIQKTNYLENFEETIEENKQKFNNFNNDDYNFDLINDHNKERERNFTISRFQNYIYNGKVDIFTNKYDSDTLINTIIDKRRETSKFNEYNISDKSKFIQKLALDFGININSCATDEECENALKFIITTYLESDNLDMESVVNKILDIFQNKNSKLEQLVSLKNLLNNIKNVKSLRNELHKYYTTKDIINNQNKLKDFKIMMGVISKSIGWTPLEWNFYIDGNRSRLSDTEYLTYAVMIGSIDIENKTDLMEFKRTIAGENTKFSSAYNAFLNNMTTAEIEWERSIEKDLTLRFEAAARVAENRKFYESDFIKFDNLHSDQQNQSGLHVASNIRNINSKLDNYGHKSEKNENEKNPAIMYTAFDITFKNTFNINNPAVSKLAAQGVDLRDDLSRYRIYDQDNNFFDKDARDKYVTEKLIPIGLTPDEIGNLGKAVEGLPNEVAHNYEILSGNFYADQDSFEKISKIYALGEIIDNIKKLFASNETLSDNNKLSNFMGLELDENEPADIVGDCLLLKGKVNGAETKIKYNLRTGKLYMNSFTQQYINPPKITIGNNEPDTEVGDLGNFDDLLQGYAPKSSLENEDNTPPSSDSQYSRDTDNSRDMDSSDSDSNQKTLEKLMENKLFEKVSEIGRIVKEKVQEQSQENNVINDFLKTFNILPDNGDSKNIEFLGGSNLFILLESIKNTNNGDYLQKFSQLMSELMSFCGFEWGKNNLRSKEPDFSSITIFDIDEKNATTDIISLQRANKTFFDDTNGEKDKIKGYESHFDDSAHLSFADIIVQKCCRRYGDGWKISAKLAEDYVNSIKKGITDIQNDNNDIVAIEELIDNDEMWA